MYKFTNGVVVYDEITKDKYIKAGMILVQEEPKEKEKTDGEENIRSISKREEFRNAKKRTEKFGRNFR